MVTCCSLISTILKFFTLRFGKEILLLPCFDVCELKYFLHFMFAVFILFASAEAAVLCFGTLFYCIYTESSRFMLLWLYLTLKHLQQRSASFRCLSLNLVRPTCNCSSLTIVLALSIYNVLKDAPVTYHLTLWDEC